MSEPRPTNDINLYLAALNAELSVGLRSRSRILEEVGDHLEAAASAEREAMLADPERRGPVVDGEQALAAEATRRAIARFGSPRETAAGFETGVFGMLDRRLAALDAHVDRWLARPLAWAGAGALGMVALAAAVVALGAFFEVPNADGQLAPTFALTGVLIFCMRAAYVLRGKLPPGGGAALRGLRCKPKAALAFRDYIPFAFFACYASIAFPWDLFEWLALWVCLAALVELGGRTASRIRARSAGGSARRPCGPDANWSAYLRVLWTSVGITSSLVLMAPGPLELKAVVVLLVVGVTGITATMGRLAWNSSVRRYWGSMYEAHAGRGRWRVGA